jgi:hypothetical protein
MPCVGDLGALLEMVEEHEGARRSRHRDHHGAAAGRFIVDLISSLDGSQPAV